MYCACCLSVSHCHDLHGHLTRTEQSLMSLSTPVIFTMASQNVWFSSLASSLWGILWIESCFGEQRRERETAGSTLTDIFKEPVVSVRMMQAGITTWIIFTLLSDSIHHRCIYPSSKLFILFLSQHALVTRWAGHQSILGSNRLYSTHYFCLNPFRCICFADAIFPRVYYWLPKNRCFSLILCVCRSTCASWSTRWNTPMSARRTLWPCTMAAALSKT